MRVVIEQKIIHRIISKINFYYGTTYYCTLTYCCMFLVDAVNVHLG